MHLKVGASVLAILMLGASSVLSGEFVCGDGEVDPPIETCDPPGTTLSNDAVCRFDCTFCGDGYVQPLFEACDDGNDDPDDGCADDCHVPLFVDPGGDDVGGDGSPEHPFATIQKALDSAPDFTRIIVRSGTYTECLRAGYPDILDRPVKLIAEDWLTRQDNSVTTISGQGVCDHSQPVPDRAPVVRIGSRASTLEGFTITGGGDSGIHATGSVTITNNVITGNHGTQGGGIFFYSGAKLFSGDVVAEISRNQITNNHAEHGATPANPDGEPEGGKGGGVYVHALGREGDLPTSGDARVSVSHNRIHGNTIQNGTSSSSVELHGGGLGVFTSSTPEGLAEVVITNNVITSNGVEPGARGYGGGAWIYTYGYGTERITARDNTIEDNRANLDGGGLSAWITTYGTRINEAPETPQSHTRHEIVIDNNVVRNNSASENGGGLDLYVFARNLTDDESARLVASGNQVEGNSAFGSRGGGAGILATMTSWRSRTPNTGIVLDGNRIIENRARVSGGGISLLVQSDSNPPGDTADPRPEPAPAVAEVAAHGNLVANNLVDGAGGAEGVGGGVFTYIQAFEQGTTRVTLDRMTIADNVAAREAGGVHVETFIGFDNPPGSTAAGHLEIWNSIITGNTGWGVGGPYPGREPGARAPGSGTGNLSVDVKYSDVWGHPAAAYRKWIGDPTGTHGNVATNPMFGDGWIPQPCSPTIDGAEPGLEVGDERLPNGGRANMGHTGGTSIAATSLPDVNRDGIVDGTDISDLSRALGAMAGDPEFDDAMDIDGNGIVDGIDMAYIAEGYLEQCL